MRDHVTIRLATGEIKTMDWDDLVVSTERRVTATPSRDPVLDFTADDAHAVLERRSEAGDFVEVCHSPCREVGAAGTYRVAGDGLIATQPFYVQQADTRVSASMSTSALKRVGAITSIASAPVLLVGFILMVASISAPPYSSTIGSYGYPVQIPNDNSALGAANAVVNIVGVVALVSGLAMLGLAHSRVSVNRFTF